MIINFADKKTQAVHVVVFSLTGGCIMGSFTHAPPPPMPANRSYLDSSAQLSVATDPEVLPFAPTAIAVSRAASAGSDQNAGGLDDAGVAAVACTRGQVLLVDCGTGAVFEEVEIPHAASGTL